MFASKRELGRDYVMPPIEGLWWWAEDMDTFTHGLRMAGTHHETYLSDFRKVAPDKLRTILRQPVVPV